MIETLTSLALAATGYDLSTAKQFSGEVPAGTVQNPNFSLIESLGGRRLSSGVHVTPELSMQASTVNACVRVRSESIASLPFITFRSNGDSKTRASDSRLYDLLHDRPNSWMTSFEWRELTQRHYDLHGNAYSLIERDSNGEIADLHPLRSDRVTILKALDKYGQWRTPFFRCSELRGAPIVPRERIFHLRGLSNDGYLGRSPIVDAPEAVGLAIALERYGASLFGSGALHMGAWIFNGTFSAEEYAVLKKTFDERYGGGLRNGVRPALFDGDWKWQQTSMDASKAQALEARDHQIADVARFYRMPLPMIGHADKTSTYASAEQFFLSFVTHCLMPVVVRWEQAIRRDLLTGLENDLAPTLLVDGLLRGDIKTRFAVYAIARQWGILNVDEIRAMEDRNPLPNGAGETYLQPMNMGDAAAAMAAGDPAKAVASAYELLGAFLRQNAAEIEAEVETDA